MLPTSKPAMLLRLNGSRSTPGYAAATSVYKTKSIFSVVREDDSVFAPETQTYDGKDELN